MCLCTISERVHTFRLSRFCLLLCLLLPSTQSGKSLPELPEGPQSADPRVLAPSKPEEPCRGITFRGEVKRGDSFQSVTIYKQQRPAENYAWVFAPALGSKDFRVVLSAPPQNREPEWATREFTFVVQRSRYREAKALIGELSHPGNRPEHEFARIQQKLRTIERGQGSPEILDYRASFPVPLHPQAPTQTECLDYAQFEVKLCFPVTKLA